MEELKECIEFVECLWKNRKVFPSKRAKVLRRDLEMALDRHIKNLHDCKLQGIKAILNSALILEDKLLKLKKEIETQSPEEIGGDYGWLMMRLPSQLNHIQEFNKFAQGIAWDEFYEDEITERMFLNIEQFGIVTKKEIIGKEVNMNELLKLLMLEKYNHIDYINGYIVEGL